MTVQTVSREELSALIKQEFAAGREFVLTVTGDSMGPTLRHLRDRVILVSPDKKKPRRGDIVLFSRKDGAFVLHRILNEKEDGTYIMNGDAQTWMETADGSHIFAVVEGIVRKNRYISCGCRLYRAYVRVWQLLRPARPYMIVLQRTVKRILGR